VDGGAEGERSPVPQHLGRMERSTISLELDEANDSVGQEHDTIRVAGVSRNELEAAPTKVSHTFGKDRLNS